MQKVLVAYGSKMGGTVGIADRIADTLAARGFDVTRSPASEAPALDGFDGIVVGSALYSGRWRPEAVQLLQRLVQTHAQVPLWVFHTGPLGDEHAGEPQPFPKKVQDLTDQLTVLGAVTFPGRLPDKPQGLLARLMARSHAGDWRDFGEIEGWANEVADTLQAASAST